MHVVSGDMLSTKLVAITLQLQFKHFSNKYFTRAQPHTGGIGCKQTNALCIYIYCITERLFVVFNHLLLS